MHMRTIAIRIRNNKSIAIAIPILYFKRIVIAVLILLSNNWPFQTVLKLPLTKSQKKTF